MKTNYFIIITILVILATACVSREIKCKLTEEVKKSVPYELKQIVSFIDRDDQIIDLTVININTWWYKEVEGTFRSDYLSIERKEIILKSEKNNLEITLSINARCSFNDDYNTIAIKIDGDYTFSEWLRIDFDGLFEVGTSTTIHDSVEINNKIYYDVVESKRYYENDTSSTQLFYNKTFGILQIIIDDIVILTLNQ